MKMDECLTPCLPMLEVENLDAGVTLNSRRSTYQA